MRPAFPSGKNDSEFMSNEEFMLFFENFFDIWYKDNTEKVKLKQISDVYDEFVKVLEPKLYKPTCTYSKNCFGNFLSLDVWGNVYTCNRTYNIKEFFLGNLKQDRIETIMEKIEIYKNRRMQNIINSECKDCNIYKFCFGGCPANSYELYNDYEKPYKYFCKAQKEIYNYIKEVLSNDQQIIKYQKEINKR